MLELQIWTAFLALCLILVALTIYAYIAGSKWITVLLFFIAGTGLLITGFTGLDGLKIEDGKNTTTPFNLVAANQTTYSLNTSDNTTFYISSLQTNYYLNATNTSSTYVYRTVANTWTQGIGLLLVAFGIGLNLFGLVYLLDTRRIS